MLTFKGDVTDVVAIAEHFVDVLDTDGSGWTFRCCGNAQAAPLQSRRRRDGLTMFLHRHATVHRRYFFHGATRPVPVPANSLGRAARRGGDSERAAKTECHRADPVHQLAEFSWL